MQNPSTLLVVKDLNISLDFYVNVLGLELIEKHVDCLKLNIAQHQLIIFQGDGKCVEYRHGGQANSTLLFTVEDLDWEISRLKSAGVEFVHSSPNHNRWGRYAAFKDPSGIIHELFQKHCIES